MGRRCRRIVPLSAALAAAACALLAASPQSARATDHALEGIALEGATAPGTGGGRFAPGFLAVSLNAWGDVAFPAQVSGGTATSGIFAHAGGTLGAVSLQGDAAPEAGGSYSFLGGFPSLNDAGAVSFLAFVSGGSTTHGVFVDTGGSDAALVLSGAAAPLPPGGSFDPTASELDGHSLDAFGNVAFASSIAGGSAASGLFIDAGGTESAVVLSGDPAPGSGGGSYDGFLYPSRHAGRLSFVASVAGGSAPSGIFVDVAGTQSALALAGDPAPRSGGGAYLDFLFPFANAAGTVVFLANVTGGNVAGGIFLDDAGNSEAVVVENDPAPGTGGGKFVSVLAFAPINGAGDVVFPAAVFGGSVAEGVFRYDASTQTLARVVLAGDPAPDAGGASFASFGFVDLNERGQVAMQATLSDGRQGIFLATPAPTVPAVTAGGLVAAALLLLATAGRALRRGAASSRS